MDPVLAEMFGTAQSPEQKEKVAHTKMLEEFAGEMMKVAEEEGLDPNVVANMSAEEVEALMNEAYTEEESEEEALEKRAAAILEEGSLFGKVAAHSFTKEVGDIQEAMAKQAAEGEPGPIRRAAGAVREGAGKAYKAVGMGAQRIGEKALSAPGVKGPASRMSEKGRRRLARAIGVTGPTLGAAGLTYGGYRGVKALRGRGKEKDSSDEMVLNRAAELLQDAGYDPNEFFEKTASEYTQEEIDTAALQYLEDSGVPVVWNQ